MEASTLDLVFEDHYKRFLSTVIDPLIQKCKDCNYQNIHDSLTLFPTAEHWVLALPKISTMVEKTKGKQTQEMYLSYEQGVLSEEELAFIMKEGHMWFPKFDLWMKVFGIMFKNI
jgi:hypothetical protein